MIRKVSGEDAIKIADIYNYYINKTVITFEEVAIDASEMSQRIDKISQDNLPWFIAENENGELVGYAYAAKWRERYSYRFAVEVTVYLRPGVEQKGLGTALYQRLFSALKDRGYKTVIGGITLPNDASIALHEKFAMEKVAHFYKVGLKFDQWLDVGYWQGQL